eukprot:TRINITY_DN20315_c0_g1_i1.p2 TRINITY_DN20315_c0_g1~~TRINITY_DN20315_c0_g1_i1.p2  ORF type:complete len:140 (+),score=8.86 TRINITY_DN20315_c0_g1_i1:987-1406(+)
MAVPQDKRLGSIEEILHTNEMTVGNILGRLKDLELMLSQKARGQASAESVTVLGGEMMAAKQRLENLERSLNVGIQKLEDDVTKQSRQAGMQASKQATQVCAIPRSVRIPVYDRQVTSCPICDTTLRRSLGSSRRSTLR